MRPGDVEDIVFIVVFALLGTIGFSLSAKFFASDNAVAGFIFLALGMCMFCLSGLVGIKK